MNIFSTYYCQKIKLVVSAKYLQIKYSKIVIHIFLLTLHIATIAIIYKTCNENILKYI